MIFLKRCNPLFRTHQAEFGGLSQFSISTTQESQTNTAKARFVLSIICHKASSSPSVRFFPYFYRFPPGHFRTLGSSSFPCLFHQWLYSSEDFCALLSRDSIDHVSRRLHVKAIFRSLCQIITRPRKIFSASVMSFLKQLSVPLPFSLLWFAEGKHSLPRSIGICFFFFLVTQFQNTHTQIV